VEVREVRDPKALELSRQPCDRERELAQPHPPCFVPAPREPAGRDAGETRAGGDESGTEAQTLSFSTTGFIETTWRLNFSSDSSSPAATPISCARWMIGMR